MVKKTLILAAGLTIIAVALCLSGCAKKVTPEGPDAKPMTDSILETSEEGAVEFPLGLYINMGTGTRDLQTEVMAHFSPGVDLAVLSAFVTTEPAISGSKFGPVWSSYWEDVPELTSYKIGYTLSYKISTGDAVTQTIYSPKDTEVNREYLETYIYDDVHQTGWYSHLLTTDITDETVITSLKLTGGPNVLEVSEVELEAFLYKSSDPTDRAGSYTVNIEKK